MPGLCRFALISLGLTLIIAPVGGNDARAADQVAAASDADDFIVVDCRLPPRTRKLGSQAIYQTAGRLIRTPAKDCEIRGGEYTLDDPGTYSGAIKRWTPGAEKGDPEAQTNLGTLYQRSNPPDYATAASWYAKAAAQNYAAAETALGELYETGKGVPKDPVKALNLYRQASGITDKTLDFIAPAADAAPKVGSPPAASANLPPPEIEIVYPLAVAGADQAKLRLRAAASVTSIVGRVVSQSGVQHVTADGQPVTVDSEGYFTLSLASVAKKPSFHLAANDLLGRAASLDVTLGQGPDPGAAPVKAETKAKFGRFYALIIGNSQFKNWPEIDNSVPDARSIDAVLRTHYGFTTTLLLNASRRQMLEAFNTMRETLQESDNLVIYYAGHGYLNPQVDRGYWIPIEADTDSDSEWILNEQITDYLQIIPAKHILVIADSCYSGVLTRSSVERPKPGLDLASRDQAMQALAQKRVRTVMTSGGVQPVLDSGVGNHSAFAYALIKILTENNDLLEANRLFDAVSPEVIKLSAQYHYNQTPTYRALTFAGHEGGDFLFVPVNGGG